MFIKNFKLDKAYGIQKIKVVSDINFLNDFEKKYRALLNSNSTFLVENFFKKELKEKLKKYGSPYQLVYSVFVRLNIR